jgi:CheY-like chemotaxis protein
MGLGLTIVKQFAELHGGSVRATSAGAGRGATLVLELPLASTDAAEPGALLDARRARQASDALAGVRVLVVDDQPDALSMIRHVLEARSARVRAAASAEIALELVEREAFDVIVSDVAMPGLDGYDFVGELRKRGIDTPALALTALALAEDRGKALAAGYQEHLSKPVDTAAVVAAVARLVER